MENDRANWTSHRQREICIMHRDDLQKTARMPHLPI